MNIKFTEGTEIDSSAIVLRGNFKPKEIYPAWLFKNELISEEDLNTCRIDIIHPDACTFGFDWIQFTGDRDLLQAEVPNSNAYSEKLRDIIIGLLSVMPDLNIRVLGINRSIHVPLDSEDLWHAVGDYLAPKEVWRSLSEGRPGMATLTIESPREKPLGYLRTIVEPSRRLGEGRLGVYFRTNNHYACEGKTLDDVIELIRGRFDRDIFQTIEIAETILDYADSRLTADKRA